MRQETQIVKSRAVFLLIRRPARYIGVIPEQLV
jgi:hypothetical protein